MAQDLPLYEIDGLLEGLANEWQNWHNVTFGEVPADVVAGQLARISSDYHYLLELKGTYAETAPLSEKRFW